MGRAGHSVPANNSVTEIKSMNTDKLSKITSRDVAPQWGGGKGNNLGAFTVNAKELTGEGIVALVGESPLMANAMADLVNGQLHIRFGSKLCLDQVKPSLREKGKDEDIADYLAATLEQAREVAKVKLAGFSPDYIAEFRRWASEDFAKRGEKKDTRPVLADYDKFMAGVDAHWAVMSDEKKTGVLTALSLDAALIAGDAAQVKAAIEAKYQRPVAVVKADSLFGE